LALDLASKKGGEMKIFLWSLFSFICYSNFSLGKSFEEKLTEEIFFGSGYTLRIINENGHIFVDAWDKDSLKIEVQKIVRNRSREEAERLLNKIKVNIITEENCVRINPTIPQYENIAVQFDILIPRKVNLELITTNGVIKVKSIGGQMRLSTTNGVIESEGVSGNVVTEATNGNITLKEVSGQVSAKTTNGSIKTIIAALDKRTTSRFETTNGSITLDIPEDSTYAIYAHTDLGRVKSEFPIFLKERDLKVKEGVRIIVKSTIGSIVISRSKKR